MASKTIFSPAKLNLFLAITGKRPDGFHELVSVVTPLAFGDTLTIEVLAEDAEAPGRFRLTCTDPEVPCDDSNLVLRAARDFAMATRWRGSAAFHLQKRIPMGAGLGGGSSNGAATLRALNELRGKPLDRTELSELAAGLGSDCPLFLHDGPVVMRGRGEAVAPLPASAAARLSGRRVLVFKPPFGVPTVWAYRRLAEMAAKAPAGPASVYLSGDQAENRLARWLAAEEAPVEELLFNTLEQPAFSKHLALPTLLEQLSRQFALAPRMSGSGSACFALLPDDRSIEPIEAAIRDAWGGSAFVVDTRLA